MDFTTLTLKQAEEAIPDANAEWLKANKKFYEGDHWQEGAGWSGPTPEADHPLHNELALEIKRGFVSKNTVAEVTNRHVAGVIGREPMWNMALRRALSEGEEPTKEEQALIDEAEALLTEWWDSASRGVSWRGEAGQSVHAIIQDAAATCLWAERGTLRLFIPAGQLEQDTTDPTRRLVPQGDLKASIMRIYLDHPDPARSAVILDRETMKQAGIYLYEKDKQKFAELTYLDGAGNTVIRIAAASVDEPQDAALRQAQNAASPIFTLPLGQITMHELARERLITDQVVQNQRALNLALTMLSRNVVMGGFLERTYLNAQLPGRMEDDPNRPGSKRFVPEQMHVGAGATNFISGVTTTDANGNEILATPSLIYRDPVPVDTFRNTKAESYRTILEEVQQLHALISGDATSSGESRKQAQSDFKQSLSDTRTQVEAALRWLLETVLAMAAVFAGQPGRYASLRAVASCHLDLGPVSADDQRVTIELVDKEIISRETARARVGVDDVDAEATRIEAEQEAIGQRTQQNLATAVLNAQRSLAGGGASNGLEQPGNNNAQEQE